MNARLCLLQIGNWLCVMGVGLSCSAGEFSAENAPRNRDAARADSKLPESPQRVSDSTSQQSSRENSPATNSADIDAVATTLPSQTTKPETKTDNKVDVAPTPRDPEPENETDVCTPAERGKLRFIIIFDNSTSNSNSELNAMKSGADHLVKLLGRIAAKENSPSVHFSAVKMDLSSPKNSGAQRGPQGWIEIKGENVTAAMEETKWGSTKGYNTFYDSTLLAAEALFRENGASVQKANERNYLVFFGDDGAERHSNSSTIAGRLATELGVAIFGIGTGGSVNRTLAEMSKPTQGILDAVHVGRSFATKTGNDILKAFDTIGTSIQSVSFCE